MDRRERKGILDNKHRKGIFTEGKGSTERIMKASRVKEKGTDYSFYNAPAVGK